MYWNIISGIITCILAWRRFSPQLILSKCLYETDKTVALFQGTSFDLAVTVLHFIQTGADHPASCSVGTLGLFTLGDKLAGV